MFKFKELRTVHLEITNNCQASCPMCARNYHGGQENPLIKINNWSLTDFTSIFTDELLNQLTGIYFCGNFGDPILNNDLLSMIDYLAERAPHIHVDLHTNGGARSADWWHMLAKTMPKSHNVCFGIDGLEDTHHIYRIGTTYENVIKNATAFIAAGGNAEWAFIKFKHNEHQEQEARHRAQVLRFKKFTLKNSNRFLGEDRYRVLDKQGNVVNYIEPSGDTTIKFVSKDMIQAYKQVIMQSDITCKVQKTKEIYIDAYKNIMPCCWLGSIPYTQYDYDNVSAEIRNDIRSQYNELQNTFGNMNALEIGIKNLLESDSWQTKWHNYWTERKLIVCAKVCGNKVSGPEDQFVERAEIS